MHNQIARSSRNMIRERDFELEDEALLDEEGDDSQLFDDNELDLYDDFNMNLSDDLNRGQSSLGVHPSYWQ